MNKKIALSGLSIVAALTLMGGATFAAFTVNATSSGSTFSSGNPSIQLCNSNQDGSKGACASQIPNPINVSDLIPGSPKTFSFWIQNNGSDPLSPLNGIFSNASGSGSGSSNVLETDLNVGLDCNGNISGSAATGGTVDPTAFSNWESGEPFIGGSLAVGSATQCTITVEVPSGNTKDANQTLNFDATISGSAGS